MLSFTETDPDKQPLEIQFYQKAQELKLHVHEYPLSYTDIQKLVDKGRFVIVFYDTLEEVGNHSLIYEINEKKSVSLIVLMLCLKKFSNSSVE